MAVKSFSTFLDKNLEAKVIHLIEKRFYEIYSDTDMQVRNKDYREMGNNMKYLNNLVSFISQLIQKSSTNNLACILRDLNNKIA
jgi:hypothetical protein